MSNGYKVQCDRGAVELEMTGAPRVHAFCHCEDCRTLLDVPYHSVAAWGADKVRIASGENHVGGYKYPTLIMTRVFCKHCGETVYNTSAMSWRLVSQLQIRKCNNDELPEEFKSNAHVYYDRRFVDIDAQNPKG